MALSADAKKRKDTPIYSGFIKYFPDAIAAVAELSRIGGEQHNPGKPLFWDRAKSADDLDAAMRHLTDHAKGILLDTDRVMHLTKTAWRAMAALQKALEDQGIAQLTETSIPDTDCKSRWLMQDSNGFEWETTNAYTYKDVVKSFGASPVLRLHDVDLTTCDDIPRDHPVACPCYACAKQRRDAAGAWE